MLKINRGWTLKRLRRRIYVCHMDFKNKSVPSWSSIIRGYYLHPYIINRVVRPYYGLKFYKKSEAEKFFPPKFVFENISWSCQCSSKFKFWIFSKHHWICCTIQILPPFISSFPTSAEEVENINFSLLHFPQCLIHSIPVFSRRIHITCIHASLLL